MIRALVTGSLYGPPQARTSQAGKQFVTAKVKADGKDGAVVWCSVIAFGEQADRLMTLGDGAALSVSGRAEVNGWLDKQGEPAPRRSPRRPVATAPGFDDALQDCFS